MTITEIAAWVGALSGLGSLGWNIYLKLTAGPKLEVSVNAHMRPVPSPPGNPAYFRITVRNNGTAPTTLTHFSFQKHNSRWNRLKGIENNIPYVIKSEKFQGPSIPFILEVGREWTGLIRKDDDHDIVELLKTQTLWVAVDHSFSKNSTRVKISNRGT